MAYMDPGLIGESFLIIAGLISLMIAILSMRSYLMIRSWKFLVLSISFLLLALPRLLLLPSFIGIWEMGSSDIVNPLTMTYVLLSVGSCAAFVLLAFLYHMERVEGGLRITAPLGALGGLLIVVQGILLLGLIGGEHASLDGSAVQGGLDMMSLLSLVLSNILIAIIIISLAVYYREKRRTGTLLALNGFSLILIAQTLTLLLLGEGAIATVYDLSNGWLISFTGGVSLIGFLAFLYAILRLKVSNGRKQAQAPL